jgi:outer membrane protein assembly factor BamB
MFEHTGGNYTWSRNLQYSSGGASVISTPAVGEISSSEGTGIVVCTAEGYEWDDSPKSEKPLWGQSAVYLLDPADGQDIWPQPADYDAWFAASPVIGDVDDDGVCELIVGTEHAVGSDRRRVLVLDGATGSEEANWFLGTGIYHSAAVADIDSDGSLDFVVPCNDGCIYGWTGDGYEALPGFPVNIGEIPGSPAIADIDADMELEIVVGTSDGSLWALEADGSTCSGYPLQVGGNIQGCPAIGEIDGDGHLEVIMVDAGQPRAYCLDLGAGTFPAEMPWRQFQHDSWHTGC